MYGLKAILFWSILYLLCLIEGFAEGDIDLGGPPRSKRKTAWYTEEDDDEHDHPGGDGDYDTFGDMNEPMGRSRQSEPCLGYGRLCFKHQECCPGMRCCYSPPVKTKCCPDR